MPRKEGKKRRFGRIRQLSSGRWQARYRGPDGRDRAAPRTYATEREAQQFLSIVEGDIARDRWVLPVVQRTTVAQWTEQWWVSAHRSWKPKTRDSYRSLLDRTILPVFGPMPLTSLRPIQVARWVGELSDRLSASQVRQAYRLLSQVMRAAVENDIIAVSPCRSVRLPRLPEANPTILTVAQVDRLAAACQLPDRVLVLLLAYGGLRIGEALALRRRHMNIEAGRLTVAQAVAQLTGGPVIDTPKNHQRRELAVPAFVVQLLREHLATLPDDPDAFMFPGRQEHTTGRQQSYAGFRRRFNAALKASGLVEVTPHDLRATHASWVADSHGVLVAARRLGHANASVTTRHYARTVDERDAEVAKQLDANWSKTAKTSGTQRARKPRKA